MDARVSTGIDGLDEVLNGGLIPNRSYMIRGPPGAGKTLLGLHFLVDGATEEGNALFVNLGEAAENIRRDAANLGFDLGDVELLDLSPSSEYFVEDQSYDVFPADEVEQGSLTEPIVEAVEDTDPDRVLVDPMTQFRYLSADDLEFRKQVLSFLRYLKSRDCTVLFTSQDTEAQPDDDLQFMSDGIVSLDRSERSRTVQVEKFRGSDFRGGTHAVDIGSSGMDVFPQLQPRERSVEFSSDQLSSGVSGVDDLLDGGLERGTVTLLTGPSGVGKTTTGAHFVKEVAKRGERSVIYMFEESETTFLHRCESVDIPVEKMTETERLGVEEVNARSYSAEEFAASVRSEVEERDTSLIMIDGIEGYQLALGGDGEDENELTRKLHSLNRYLQNEGVTVLLVSEVQSVTGEFEASKHDVSYLADNIVFLQYLEFEGEIRKAVGVLKKRAGDFERTLRQFEITEDGIEVGEPLTGLRGVLEGSPTLTDQSETPYDAAE
jgi:circadian clock protein KaiC